MISGSVIFKSGSLAGELDTIASFFELVNKPVDHCAYFSLYIMNRYIHIKVKLLKNKYNLCAECIKKACIFSNVVMLVSMKCECGDCAKWHVRLIRETWE